MSASQVTVILVCLVVGYITVSWLLDLGRPADKPKAPPGGPPPRPADPQQRQL